jgi:hypothetical protein
MVDDVNSKYPLDGGIEERLREMAKSESKLFPLYDKIVIETLQSWHPNLSEKELVICADIFNHMHDCHLANAARYNDKEHQPLDEYEYFIDIRDPRGCNRHETKKEIADIIRNLISKSVLELRQEEWQIDDYKAFVRVVGFVEEDLYEELYRATHEYEKSTLSEYFCPREGDKKWYKLID